MRITNVRVYTEERRFVPGEIRVVNDRIAEVCLCPETKPIGGTATEEVMDGAGCYAIPGMIDMHFHGLEGFDFCDGTGEAVSEIAIRQLKQGVTAIAPATMTLPLDKLEKVLSVAAKYQKAVERNERQQPLAATLVGINLEGPFISESRCGAQNSQYILKPDDAVRDRLLLAGEGLVKIMGVAPETVGAAEFIERSRELVTISIAHSNAGYEEAKLAFSKGAGHVVHLFNGMSAFHHRDPGIVGAASDDETVTVELICDGVHVHAAMVRAAFRIFGAERVIMVSDSMRATGLSDGVYTLGGQDVQVQGRLATLVRDGSLAGSVTTLPECVRVAVKQMGLPLEEVVACVTVNPAKRLGIDDSYGTIKAGRKADLVLLDESLTVRYVMKSGKPVVLEETESYGSGAEK